MRIAMVTEDERLYQKIKLLLLGKAEVVKADGRDSADEADLFMIDLRGFSENTSDAYKKTYDGVRTLTVGKGGDIPYPFIFEELTAALEGGCVSEPILTCKDRCAYLRGEKIHLTEVEFALLDVLYRAGGEFVSREELLMAVWGGEADEGVVNVYIYYLRKKLERGEKIINTSRKLGYKIDKKYMEEESC